MFFVNDSANARAEYGKASNLCGSYAPVTSIEQVYRMLQESEDSVAQGRIFTKEEVLKNMETALNS